MGNAGRFLLCVVRFHSKKWKTVTLCFQEGQKIETERFGGNRTAVTPTYHMCLNIYIYICTHRNIYFYLCIPLPSYSGKWFSLHKTVFLCSTESLGRSIMSLHPSLAQETSVLHCSGAWGNANGSRSAKQEGQCGHRWIWISRH